ncbi:hypothetical protein SERLA73DRAFT_61618 [Serpula lacrymans var. lacrymans S7.3]|uniref:Nucleoporin NUP188 n=2 Tax=Serpula lacrymans var. lacrymans TaxID=341189 RepID=F8Q8T4_SERL3|nr:uncharacterized protein SERLADRAFT_441822 [Serpula lacrymans var. lacrymans S7.9]EGN94989.1 hypothetical protein SERLA73DRAFT_61618 [Serpula lacrymans var. lacrymans S7.3]EGO20482.1 hypothetical protein SERLADRAFT_441822 [Serpula lacrymans var. lacrymans S7.9]
MSGESSKRSNLVDVTYQQLHSVLSGRLEGTTPDQIADILKPRISQLRNITEPFGKPSNASRKTVESGSVTLSDGVVLHLDDVDKEFVFAISSHFEIDEVQSLILLRSFLYNEGLPSNAGSSSDKSVVDELVAAITPFYYAERLFVLRSLIPLFRAQENTVDPIHAIALEELPKILPDGQAFADSLLKEYLRKTKQKVPATVSSEPRAASRWAKQNAKEQLVMLEVLFWTMWGYVPCDGPFVVRIMEASYSSNLGLIQGNATLMLDDEGEQLQQDCAALWILITIEVLELERLAERNGVEISADPSDKTIYTSSPESLKRIHELVTSPSHGNSHHACTYLAWAFVLSRLTSQVEEAKEIPDGYRSFFESLVPHQHRSKEREQMHVLMARTCLSPDVGLFKLISTLLTTSPLFVTVAAWKTGSTITDPNAIAFRSVLKGLVIALVELVPVELVPDFDALVEVWIALFGRSESQSIAGICRQYWQSDWRQGMARRAIFDVARSRFPIQLKPLIRLLRAMTAAGFLDTDQLSTADHSQESEGTEEERELCGQHVFFYLDKLPTFSQVIPASACTGSNAIYEKLQERYGSMPSPGLTYVNLRPIKLPGGSTLPARSTGRLLSGDGGEFMAICWQHEHSGWKVILEVLTDYVNRKRSYSGAERPYRGASSGRSGSQPLTLKLSDIGMEMESEGDEDIATDTLDLIRSIIQENAPLAEELLDSLESGDSLVSHSMGESQPPDLVQLTTMILEEALNRPANQTRSFARTQLITSAMSVLSALLSLPKYSLRVWLYIRSTSALFGPSRSAGFASVALAAERISGHYTMTLALLQLVQQLFHEAASSVLTILPENARLQQVKEEVLLRATSFVHGEIWVEHLVWKYAQLGDKFEVGRRVSSFYADVLSQAPPTLTDRPFATLSQTIADILLHKATTSTINPLVSSITAGSSILGTLYATRRFGDARRLIYLLESHLHLVRLVLNYKQMTPGSSKPCLLEQALCARVAGGANFSDSTRSRVDPIDVLATYVKERGVGAVIPLEAMKVLYSLCASLSTTQPSPPTIIGHLTNPEATVASFVRIVQHPYDDLSLRNAVWNFISLAVDKEPALASLFVTGQFRIPASVKGKGGELSDGDASKKVLNAVDIAHDALGNWKELWEHNPQLMASVLRFLDVVWQHGLEHKTLLDNMREDEEFWSQLSAITREELGPWPDYTTESYVLLDGARRSNFHEAVSMQAYRTMAKSYALHIIGQDIYLRPQPPQSCQPTHKAVSYNKIRDSFKVEEQLTEYVLEAAASSYDPAFHDDLIQQIQVDFPALTLEQLQSQEPVVEREFGDDFTFSLSLLRSRLQHCATTEEGVRSAEEVEKKISSINLNLSLTQAQTALAESWQFLLRQALPLIRAEQGIRPSMLSLAAAMSVDVASEKRSGDMMATIHGTRLGLLLSLLEVAWFSASDTPTEIKSFISLVKNVHNIILNESQSPSMSFLGKTSVPFHRTLLQIIYFCCRHCRNLIRRPKALNAEQRLTIAMMIEATLNLVIEALSLVFDSARTRLDLDLDKDMELLVAVFEQCTRRDIDSNPAQWLTRCQETDAIRSSLELFVHADLVGLSDLTLLRSRRQPLYAPHIVFFHMALASIPSGAERFASAGAISAYSNNGISAAISTGQIEVTLPELPGERSPAHRVYVSMLSIVAGVISALGRQSHFFVAEACGFVQLYGEQISRALSWSIGEPVTLPLLEEIEQVVNLFYAIAEGMPSSSNDHDAVVSKVLRVFTTHALMLLQQLNYALTHPNHLSTLLEPVTAEERLLVDKERESAVGAGGSLSPSDMVDLRKRPLTARLVHRLYKLTAAILATLISISRAYDVLLGDQEEWPVLEALIVPHSKVVLGEPTSLGTLLELGNATLDILRDLVNRPPGQNIVPPTSTSITSTSASVETLDVREGIITTRNTLEGVMIYAVTQLAMWVSKPEFEVSVGDGMNMGEDSEGMHEGGHHTTQLQHSHSPQQHVSHHLGHSNPHTYTHLQHSQNPLSLHPRDSLPQAPHKDRERRAPRASMTLAERLRRGMTGEMAADLRGLLGKASGLIAKCDGIIGSDNPRPEAAAEKKPNLSEVLLRFLNERVGAAS